MKNLTFIVEKKWWHLLLLGLANSLIFTLCFGNIPLRAMNMLDTSIILIVPFLLLLWSLCSTSFSKFFHATLFLVAIFIFAGLPLSRICICLTLKECSLVKGRGQETDLE